jgi:hypothetical protein
LRGEIAGYWVIADCNIQYKEQESEKELKNVLDRVFILFIS